MASAPWVTVSASAVVSEVALGPRVTVSAPAVVPVGASVKVSETEVTVSSLAVLVSSSAVPAFVVVWSEVRIPCCLFSIPSTNS